MADNVGYVNQTAGLRQRSTAVLASRCASVRGAFDTRRLTRSATALVHATIDRVVLRARKWMALGQHRSEVLARTGADPQHVRAVRRVAWALDCIEARLDAQTGYYATRARLTRLRAEFERISSPQLCFDFAAQDRDLARRLAVLHVA